MFCKKDEYKVLGLMSGTSLDGLDMAYCRFTRGSEGEWKYEILVAETLPWEESWQRSIHDAYYLQGPKLMEFHFRLGHEMGRRASAFIHKYRIRPDFIASHGQTIYHNPAAGYTFQAGSGAALAAQTGLPVVSDFRSVDVALGGQGAPLVPIGDKLLFSEYGACLNLGGFANISHDDAKGHRIAYDLCPANMALNHLAGMVGLPFDKEGHLASRGNVIQDLLHRLQNLNYFHETPPKSLGREWFERVFLPELHRHEISPQDGLRTVSELIAWTLEKAVTFIPNPRQGLLITGGGAHNQFLIKTFKEKLNIPLTIPDSRLVDFKEALIFAFLGVLFVEGEVNCLKEVTGARRNSIGGCLYQGSVD
ncbi:MAG: anhydro-N-acetylmuramic acid kinase [Bacteroidales bacterium]